MTREELAARIDLTLLKPEACRKDIGALIDVALSYPYATVCVPPCHVGYASKLLQGSPVKVSTVAGFPFGYNMKAAKLDEAKAAHENGASEIDVVMNISLFKSNELAYVEDELSSITGSLPKAVIKVIIEACYLSNDEKAAACLIAINSGAAFVKTSTGFGPSGATVEDVELLAKVAAGRIKVKASGGIRSLEDALRMLKAGAERIGTSSAKIVGSLPG